MCWGVVQGTSGAAVGVEAVRPAVSPNWKLIFVGESVYRSGLFLSPDCPESTGLPRPFLFADFCFWHLHTNMATTTIVRISTIAAKTPTSQPSFSSEKEIRQQFLLFKYKECPKIKQLHLNQCWTMKSWWNLLLDRSMCRFWRFVNHCTDRLRLKWIKNSYLMCAFLNTSRNKYQENWTY